MTDLSRSGLAFVASMLVLLVMLLFKHVSLKNIYFGARLCIGIFAEIGFYTIIVGAPLLWALDFFKGIAMLKLLAVTPLLYVLRGNSLSFILKKATEWEKEP